MVTLLSFFAGRLARQMQQLAHAEKASAAAAASTAVVAAHYRLLADTATEMIVTVDLKLVRQYVSPASQELVGYAPEELVGGPIGVNLHPDDLERVIACHNAMAAGRDRDRITYRVRHRDGHWVWVEATFKLIRDPVSGAPREINCSWREVGERIEAEAALRASEERHRLLLESSVIEAIYMLDPDGTIESWNSAAERIKGYARSEIVGRDFAIFSPRKIAPAANPRACSPLPATPAGTRERAGEFVRMAAGFWPAWRSARSAGTTAHCAASPR